MPEPAGRIGIGLDTRQAETDFARFVNTRLSRTYNLRLNVDDAVRPLGKISAAASDFERSLSAANARVLAFGASVSALFAFERAMSNIVKTTIDVQEQLAQINVVLNQTPKNLDIFGGQLFDIAKQTGTSFKEVGNAALELSRQGLGVEETLKRANDALILTRLSGLDSARAVETLTAAINSFSKESLSSTTIINRLANVDANFAVSSKDLAESIQRSGAAASDAGVQFNSLIALVTAVQQTTQRGGAVIGNAFRTIFTRLQRPEVLTDLEALGITVKSVSGEFLAADKILLNTAQAFDHLSQAQQSQLAETVGSVYQANQLRALFADLAKGAATYQSALQVANNTTNQAIQRNEELNKTIKSQINVTLESLKQFATAIGNVAVAPKVDPLLKVINNALSSITEKDSQGPGQIIGKGLVEGISNFIFGPGLVLILGVVAKLGSDLAKFATSSIQELLGIGQMSEKAKLIASEYSNILAGQPELISRINQGTITQIELNQRLLALLVAQSEQRAAQLGGINAAAQEAAGLRVFGGKGVKFDATTRIAQVPRFAVSATLDSKPIPNYALTPQSPRAYGVAPTITQLVGNYPKLVTPSIEETITAIHSRRIEKNYIDEVNDEFEHIYNPTPFVSTTSVPDIHGGNLAGVQEAIRRERNAGVPASLIRVGSDSSLKSPENPLGLGVYNTKDEPQGLRQGIQRAINLGIDPKKHGISPNFAIQANFSFLDRIRPVAPPIKEDLSKLPTVFHGSLSQFNEFKKGDIGFHFGSKKAARDRVENLYSEMGQNFDLDIEDVKKENPAFINKYRLNVKNPLELSDIGNWSDPYKLIRSLYNRNIIDIKEAKELARKYGKQFGSPYAIKQEEQNFGTNPFGIEGSEQEKTITYKDFSPIREILKKKGYDGIRYFNEYEGGGSASYIAFEPQQIKNYNNLKPDFNNPLLDAELPNFAKIFYHGTGFKDYGPRGEPFTEFSADIAQQQRGAIYFGQTPAIARTFTLYKDNPRIIEANLDIERPFVLRNPEHRQKLAEVLAPVAPVLDEIATGKMSQESLLKLNRIPTGIKDYYGNEINLNPYSIFDQTQDLKRISNYNKQGNYGKDLLRRAMAIKNANFAYYEQEIGWAKTPNLPDVADLPKEIIESPMGQNFTSLIPNATSEFANIFNLLVKPKTPINAEQLSRLKKYQSLPKTQPRRINDLIFGMGYDSYMPIEDDFWVQLATKNEEMGKKGLGPLRSVAVQDPRRIKIVRETKLPNFAVEPINVNEILESLPEQQKVVLQERADGLTIQDIAKKYNITRSEVNRLFNAGKITFTKRYELAKKDIFPNFADISKFPNLPNFAPYLYHGTLKENIPSIQEKGLVPQIGPLTKTFYDEGAEPLVFMTGKHDLESAYSSIWFNLREKLKRQPTQADVQEHGALAVINPRKWYNRGIERYDEESYQHPSTSIESNDFYSKEEILPEKFITGKKLVNIFKKRVPHFAQVFYKAALRLPNGKVEVIKDKERTHFQIYQRLLDEKHPNILGYSDPDVTDGFISPAGKFLTREQMSNRLGYYADTSGGSGIMGPERKYPNFSLPNFANTYISTTKALLKKMEEQKVDFERWGDSPSYSPFFNKIKVPAKRRGGDPTDSPVFALFHEYGHSQTTPRETVEDLRLHNLRYLVNPKYAASYERKANIEALKVMGELQMPEESQDAFKLYARKYYQEYAKDKETGRKYRGVSLDPFAAPNFANTLTEIAHQGLLEIAEAGIPSLSRPNELKSSHFINFPSPRIELERNAGPGAILHEIGHATDFYPKALKKVVADLGLKRDLVKKLGIRSISFGAMLPNLTKQTSDIFRILEERRANSAAIKFIREKSKDKNVLEEYVNEITPYFKTYTDAFKELYKINEESPLYKQTIGAPPNFARPLATLSMPNYANFWQTGEILPNSLNITNQIAQRNKKLQGDFGDFVPNISKQLLSDKPFGITPDKEGNIPVNSLKSRLQNRLSQGEIQMLDDIGFNQFLEAQGKDRVKIGDVYDFVNKNAPRIEVKKPEAIPVDQKRKLFTTYSPNFANVEKIIAAAIKVHSGKIYSGRYHLEAYNKIPKEELRSINYDLVRGVTDGFLTSSGRFLTRDESINFANQSGQLTSIAQRDLKNKNLGWLDASDISGINPEAPNFAEIEKIVSAALKTKSGKIFKGIFHSEAFDRIPSTIKSKEYNPALDYGFPDGFVTNLGRFVNREEANLIAKKAKQIKKNEMGQDLDSGKQLDAAYLKETPNFATLRSTNKLINFEAVKANIHKFAAFGYRSPFVEDAIPQEGSDYFYSSLLRRELDTNIDDISPSNILFNPRTGKNTLVDLGGILLPKYESAQAREMRQQLPLRLFNYDDFYKQPVVGEGSEHQVRKFDRQILALEKPSYNLDKLTLLNNAGLQVANSRILRKMLKQSGLGEKFALDVIPSQLIAFYHGKTPNFAINQTYLNKVREASEVQRGIPESQMLKTQRELPAGMLQYFVEHVGDLSHRAGEFAGEHNLGYAGFSEKVGKLSTILEENPHRWSFEKEVEESYISQATEQLLEKTGKNKEIDKLNNIIFKRKAFTEFTPEQDAAIIKRNKIYNDARNSPEIAPIVEELKVKANKSLNQYADTHEKYIEPVTVWQNLGKKAAIALGRGDYKGLREHIFTLKNEVKKYEELREKGQENKALRFMARPVANFANLKSNYWSQNPNTWNWQKTPNFAWLTNIGQELDPRLIAQEQQIGRKPSGLWFAKNFEWLKWLKSDMPEWLQPNLYNLKLDENKILHLKTKGDISHFKRQYEVEGPILSRLERNVDKEVNWPKVASDYRGVILSDDQIWGANDWRYGWDAYSGAIWHPDALKSYQKIKIPPKFQGMQKAWEEAHGRTLKEAHGITPEEIRNNLEHKPPQRKTPNFAWITNTSGPIDLTKIAQEQEISNKPRGLWFAKNFEWLRWMQGEGMDWLKPELYNLKLDEKQIAHLRSPDEALAFEKQYKPALSEIKKLGFNDYFTNRFIDWKKVSKDFGGVILSDEVGGGGGMGMDWRYDWDLYSGAIWRPEVLKSSQKLKIPPRFRDINAPNFALPNYAPFSIERLKKSYSSGWTQTTNKFNFGDFTLSKLHDAENAPGKNYLMETPAGSSMEFAIDENNAHLALFNSVKPGEGTFLVQKLVQYAKKRGLNLDIRTILGQTNQGTNIYERYPQLRILRKLGLDNTRSEIITGDFPKVKKQSFISLSHLETHLAGLSEKELNNALIGNLQSNLGQPSGVFKKETPNFAEDRYPSYQRFLKEAAHFDLSQLPLPEKSQEYNTNQSYLDIDLKKLENIKVNYRGKNNFENLLNKVLASGKFTQTPNFASASPNLAELFKQHYNFDIQDEEQKALLKKFLPGYFNQYQKLIETPELKQLREEGKIVTGSDELPLLLFRGGNKHLPYQVISNYQRPLYTTPTLHKAYNWWGEFGNLRVGLAKTDKIEPGFKYREDDASFIAHNKEIPQHLSGLFGLMRGSADFPEVVLRNADNFITIGALNKNEKLGDRFARKVVEMRRSIQTPNFAERLLGMGKYGGFYDVERKIGDIPVGEKRFFEKVRESSRNISNDEIRSEYEASKYLSETTLHPFLTAPTIFGTLQESIKNRTIVKSIEQGATLAKYQEHDTPERAEQVVGKIQDLAQKRLDEKQVWADDLHLGNIVLNQTAQNYLDAIIDNGKLYHKFVQDPQYRDRLLRKLAERGARASIVDAGLIELSQNIPIKQGPIGKAPNFAYIPLLTPLLGRLVTNTIYPTGYSLRNKINSLQSLSWKELANVLLKDQPTKTIEKFYNEPSQTSNVLRSVPFRRMFGLQPRKGQEHYVEIAKNTISFNPNTEVGSEMAEWATNVSETGVQTAYYKDPTQKELAFIRYHHPVMGAFQGKYNRKTRTLTYSDRWDFDLNNPNETISAKAGLKELTKIFNPFEKKPIGKRLDQIKFSAGENSPISDLVRFVFSKVTSPSTIVGSVKNTGLSLGTLESAKQIAKDEGDLARANRFQSKINVKRIQDFLNYQESRAVVIPSPPISSPNFALITEHKSFLDLRNSRIGKSPRRTEFQDKILKDSNLWLSLAKGRDNLILEDIVADKDVSPEILQSSLLQILKYNPEKFQQIKLDQSYGLHIDELLEKAVKSNYLQQNGNRLFLNLAGESIEHPRELSNLIIPTTEPIPKYLSAYHGTYSNLQDLDIQKVKDFSSFSSGGAFHLGTYSAAKQRIGLSPGGGGFGILANPSGKPRLLQTILDSEKIFRVNNPISELTEQGKPSLEDYLTGEKREEILRSGFGGLAYINAGEDRGSLSLALFNKSPIVKTNEIANFASKYSLGYAKFKPNILGLKDIFKDPKNTLKRLPLRIAGTLGAGAVGLYQDYLGNVPESQAYYSMARYMAGIGGVRKLNLNAQREGQLLGGRASQIVKGEVLSPYEEITNRVFSSPLFTDGLGDVFTGLYNTIGKFRVGANKKGFKIQDAFDFDNSVNQYAELPGDESLPFSGRTIVPKSLIPLTKRLLKAGSSRFPLYEKAIGPVQLEYTDEDQSLRFSGRDLEISPYGSPFLTRITIGEKSLKETGSKVNKIKQFFSSLGQSAVSGHYPNFANPERFVQIASRIKSKIPPFPGVKEGEDYFSSPAIKEYRKKDEGFRAFTERAVLRNLTTRQALSNQNIYVPPHYEELGQDLDKYGQVVQLPKRLFHVTTNYQDVVKSGQLKSRKELGITEGTGLGGGPDETISFTDNRKIARQIQRSTIELASLLSGKRPVSHLSERAKRGFRADAPFYDKFAKFAESSLGKARFEAFQTGQELQYEPFKPKSAEELRKIGGTGVEAYENGLFYSYKVPFKPDNYDVKRLYDAFSYAQEDAGGYINPLFFSSNLESIKNSTLKNVKLIEAKPRFEKDRGLKVNALGEYRVLEGKRIALKGISPNFALDRNQRLFTFFTEMLHGKYNEENIRSILNAGGTFENNVFTLPVYRNQKAEQGGFPSVRGGVFYLPEDSPYKSAYGPQHFYGGGEQIHGDLQFKRPIFANASTGGRGPERAYHNTFGKQAYKSLNEDVVKTIGGWVLYAYAHVSKIEEFIGKYAPEILEEHSRFPEYLKQSSNRGNQLRMALQELAIGQAFKNFGYDAVVSVGRRARQPIAREIFALNQENYPISSFKQQQPPNFAFSNVNYPNHSLKLNSLKEKVATKLKLTHFTPPNFAFTYPIISPQHQNVDELLSGIIENGPFAPKIAQLTEKQIFYNFLSYPHLGRGVRGEFGVKSFPQISINRDIFAHPEFLAKRESDPRFRELIDAELNKTLGHEVGHSIDVLGIHSKLTSFRKAVDQDKLKYGDYLNRLVGISINAEPYAETFAEVIGRGVTNLPFDTVKHGIIPVQETETYQHLLTRGIIPQFAEALDVRQEMQKAIEREHEAGVPYSLIRIDTNEKLRSEHNPLGLGVYNLQHEPQGLQQGIMKALTRGFNPKTKGIPGFADSDPFRSKVFPSGVTDLMVRQGINDYARALRSGTASIDELSKTVENISQALLLVPQSSRRLEQKLRRIEATFRPDIPNVPQNLLAQYTPSTLTKAEADALKMSKRVDEESLRDVKTKALTDLRTRDQARIREEGLGQRNPFALPNYPDNQTRKESVSEIVTGLKNKVIAALPDKTELLQRLAQLPTGAKLESQYTTPTQAVRSIFQRRQMIERTSEAGLQQKEAENDARRLEQTLQRFESERIGNERLKQTQRDITTANRVVKRQDYYNYVTGFTPPLVPPGGGGGGPGGNGPTNPFDPENLRYQQALIDMATRQREEEAQREAAAQRTRQGNIAAQEIRGQILAEEREQAAALAQAQRVNLLRGRASGIFSGFGGKALNELKQINEPLANQAQATRQAKISQAGFMLSFAAPQIAGIATEAFGGPETVGGRISNAIGQTASFAGLGASFGGGVGAGVGAGVGIILSLVQTLGSLDTSLRNFKEHIDSSRESLNKNADNLNKFVSVTEQIQDIESGRVRAEPFQLARLKEEQSRVFSALPPQQQIEIGNAAGQKDMDQVRRISQNIWLGLQQKGTLQNVGASIQAFSEKPERLQKQTVQDLLSSILSLQTPNGETLFGGIVNNPEAGKTLEEFKKGIEDRKRYTPPPIYHTGSLGMGSGFVETPLDQTRNKLSENINKFVTLFKQVGFSDDDIKEIQRAVEQTGKGKGIKALTYIFDEFNKIIDSRAKDLKEAQSKLRGLDAAGKTIYDFATLFENFGRNLQVRLNQSMLAAERAQLEQRIGFEVPQEVRRSQLEIQRPFLAPEAIAFEQRRLDRAAVEVVAPAKITELRTAREQTIGGALLQLSKNLDTLQKSSKIGDIDKLYDLVTQIGQNIAYPGRAEKQIEKFRTANENSTVFNSLDVKKIIEPVFTAITNAEQTFASRQEGVYKEQEANFKKVDIAFETATIIAERNRKINFGGGAEKNVTTENIVNFANLVRESKLPLSGQGTLQNRFQIATFIRDQLQGQIDEDLRKQLELGLQQQLEPFIGAKAGTYARTQIAAAFPQTLENGKAKEIKGFEILGLQVATILKPVETEFVNLATNTDRLNTEFVKFTNVLANLQNQPPNLHPLQEQPFGSGYLSPVGIRKQEITRRELSFRMRSPEIESLRKRFETNAESIDEEPLFENLPALGSKYVGQNIRFATSPTGLITRGPASTAPSNAQQMLTAITQSKKEWAGGVGRFGNEWVGGTGKFGNELPKPVTQTPEIRIPKTLPPLETYLPINEVGKGIPLSVQQILGQLQLFKPQQPENIQNLRELPKIDIPLKTGIYETAIATLNNQIGKGTYEASIATLNNQTKPSKPQQLSKADFGTLGLNFLPRVLQTPQLIKNEFSTPGLVGNPSILQPNVGPAFLNRITSKEALPTFQPKLPETFDYRKFSEGEATIQSIIAQVNEANDNLAKNIAKATLGLETLKRTAGSFSEEIHKAAMDLNEMFVRTGSFKDINFGEAFWGQLRYGEKEFFRDFTQGLSDSAQDFKNSFSGALKDALRGGDFLTSFVTKLGYGLLDRGIDQATNSLFGGLQLGGKALVNYFTGNNAGSTMGLGKGSTVGFAQGGIVHGGSGVKDDVPAFLSAGEYVLNKRAVQNLGVARLNRMNSGGMVRGYAEGDFVDTGEFSLKNTAVFKDDKVVLDYDPRLTQFALFDPNNPQNQERQQLFNEYAAYLKAKKAFEESQSNQAQAMYISAGIQLAGLGLNYGISNRIATNTVDLKTGTTATTRAINSVYEPNTIGGYQIPSRVNYQENYVGSMFNPGPLTLGKYENGGLIPQYWQGGIARYNNGGIGTDKIPAYLTDGEYVVNKPTVEKYGVKFFDQINSGRIQRFATGGFVGLNQYDDTNATFSKLTEATEALRKSFEDRLPAQTGGNTVQVGSQGGQTNNIAISINVQGGNTEKTTPEANKENQGIQQGDAKKLADGIRSVVLAEIQRQQRQGGLLSKTR